MLAVQKSGGLFRKLSRTIGSAAIASGVMVAVVVTSASADTTLQLSNNEASNFASGTGSCADYAVRTDTSYWHFTVSTNGYSFTSITLNLDGNTVPITNWSNGDSGQGKRAYVAVPSGYTLSSLQINGSSATISPDVVGELPSFNLLYTCSGATPPPPPPIDVCNNLAGDQATMPEGLVSDGSGGCVPPPPPTDVCDNIPGPQATVPPGMVLNGKNCVTPPPTVIVVPDVCSNIPDAQSSAPAGTVANADGTCTDVQVVAPAVDVCSNVAGDQATVPMGLSQVGTTCVAVQASQAVVPAVIPPAAVAPAGATAPADVALPVTGSRTETGIAIGLVMLAAGGLLSVLARRRAPRTVG